MKFLIENGGEETISNFFIQNIWLLIESPNKDVRVVVMNKPSTLSKRKYGQMILISQYFKLIKEYYDNN